MELPVLSRSGEVVYGIEVADVLFAAPVNRALLHQVMVAQQANRRAGTHSSRTRGEVSGGGRKPRPQKYTGRSRQGSIRAPHWRGGGVAFGPRPRSHHRDVPRKMRRLAIRSALSSRAAASELLVVDTLQQEVPRTRELRDTLRRVGATRSALVVVGEPDPVVARSGRNIPGVAVLPAYRLNVEAILRYHRIVVTVEGVRRAEALWARPLTRREAA